MNKLKSNALWMVAGNTYYAACQWVVLVVIARLGNPEAVGAFTFGLAVTAPVIMFFNFGLRSILASDVGATVSFRQYNNIRLISAGAGFIVSTAVGLALGAHLVILTALAAAKSVESVIELRYGLAQQHGRLDIVSQSLIVRGTISTLAIAVFYWFTGNLEIAVLGYAFCWLISLFIIVRQTKSIETASAEGQKDYKAIILPALSLGLAALLVNLGPNIPRLVLERLHGPADLGIFSSMAYFIIVGGVVVSALGQSLVPVLARMHHSGETRKFWTTVGGALALVAGLGIAGIILAIFVGEAVLNLVYGAEFARDAHLLPLVALAATLGYLGNILGYAVSAARLFVGQAPVYTLTLVVSLVASFTLIDPYGIDGAVYVLILASLSNCVAPLLLLLANRIRER